MVAAFGLCCKGGVVCVRGLRAISCLPRLNAGLRKVAMLNMGYKGIRAVFSCGGGVRVMM